MAESSCDETGEPYVKKREAAPKKMFFRWNDKMHSSLIECLKNYKISCEFNNTDFDADPSDINLSLQLSQQTITLG